MGAQQIFFVILVTENWRLSDPDLKLVIPDLDPANKFRSKQIRLWIRKTGIYRIEILNLAMTSQLNPHCQWFSFNFPTLTPLLTWIFGVGPGRLGVTSLGKTGYSGKTAHSP